MSVPLLDRVPFRKALSGREPWHVGSEEPMLPHHLAIRDEELAWLMKNNRRHGWGVMDGKLTEKAGGRQSWARLMRSLHASGVPVAMPEGTYGGLLAYPPAQNLAAVTGGTINVAWWNPAVYSPIPANAVLAPQAYRVAATGLVTSSGAGQTLTMNPAIGTAVAGQALGASTALALGSTITNAFWYMMGDITIRTSGSSGTAYGMFKYVFGTTAGATVTVSTALFGNTVATADFQSTAQGILIAATPSAAGVSVTPTQVHLMDWN